MNFISGNVSGVWLPAIGVDEVNWLIWPALVIVSHGLLRCLFCLTLGLQVIPGHVDQQDAKRLIFRDARAKAIGSAQQLAGYGLSLFASR